VGPDTTHNGGEDGFVAKVAPNGQSLVYSGFVGGAHSDWALGITIDGSGSAYIAGSTYSTPAQGFPVVTGPDLTHNGGEDGFVAKVKADGTGLSYCGYIGGSKTDYALGVAVDELGNAFVYGLTESTEDDGFLVFRGPDLEYNGGAYDCFLAKVPPGGEGFNYRGYIGGSQTEYINYGHAVAADDFGNVYVAGGTSSTPADGFPVVTGPDLIFNGLTDVFVLKIEGTGWFSIKPDCEGAPNCYESIQDAIDAADIGITTLYVGPGDYCEPVVIDSGIRAVICGSGAPDDCGSVVVGPPVVIGGSGCTAELGPGIK
jgi:hypothetical protein